MRERLGMIEYTTSGELPLVNVYTRGQLRRLLSDAGLTPRVMWVRKLVREDLPDIGRLQRLYERIPQAWLDRVGKRFGWYVLAHAEKETDA